MLKKIDGRWLVDIQPAGRGGKRFRKKFTNQAEAKNWEAWTKTQVNKAAEWKPEKKDLRKLSDLVKIWHDHHGANLKAEKDTHARLLKMVDALGNPIAENFKAEDFTAYRKNRLDAGLAKNTLNHEHSYLRSVFNELIRVGAWKKENPLKNIRQLKIESTELTYLTSKQIKKLLEELNASRNKSATLVASICLATGARWSEAETLKTSQIKNASIHFHKTKSGKLRVIPINDHLNVAITSYIAENKIEHGKLIFEPCMGAFRKALERTKISLPDGQLTHVLRHTFASYFMQKGGNILTLQKALGHSTLNMTMRYAHLAPDHLEEIKFNNALIGGMNE